MPRPPSLRAARALRAVLMRAARALRAVLMRAARALRAVLLDPLTTGLTYRRGVHLLLGAVLLLPYLALAWLFVASVQVGGAGGLDTLGLAVLLVPATALAVGVALVPGVLALETTAARALLGVSLPDPDPVAAARWSARRRAGGWMVLNMAVGGAVALGLLTALPAAAAFLLAPWQPVDPLPTGPAAFWTPPVALLILAAAGYLVAAAGALLARTAPRLLGPTEAERLAAELAAARAAAEVAAGRNRLARDLHDSVGHALTVTTLQAGAAARLLDTDREFARRALAAIAETGRTALEELDHVVGLLREREPDRAPQPDLAALTALLDGTRAAGVPVEAELIGPVDTVPPAVSREAYRIVQEGLTNALRHAGPVPVAVRLAVESDVLELELTNPIGTGLRRPTGGRGLAGMRERVGLLRGDLVAGLEGECWRVAARLPLGTAPR